MKDHPVVLIVGGGFGGLAAARSLAHADVKVILVDRRNYHLFQPLLYQVATASLSPADISVPIRSVLRKQENCEVILAEVIGIDVSNRRLLFEKGSLEYDYLILAAGATHAYFGHEEWALTAPGIKDVEDATELRRRILLAFESAEYEGSETARRATLTFGIVGAGPTGVELAGAIKEIAGRTIPRDYRHIDTRTTRVILFEGGDRVLAGFPSELSSRAQRDLERMGVEIRLNTRVINISKTGVRVQHAGDEEDIEIRNVFWAAGVQASPLARSLNIPLDHSGRAIVNPDLSIPNNPEVFVIGDMASATSRATRDIVPGVAQGALQMGQYVGKLIARECAASSMHRDAFTYHDKGSMAIIGKAKAVAHIGRLKVGGFFGWVLWGGIHIFFLIGYRNRVVVLLRWLWNWIFSTRDARLITGNAQIDVHTPLDTGSVFHAEQDIDDEINS